MGLSLPKKNIQLDAWVAKKFMVLLKRKLQRGQVPRTGGFRKLMAAVFPDIYGDQACPIHIYFEVLKKFFIHAQVLNRFCFHHSWKRFMSHSRIFPYMYLYPNIPLTSVNLSGFSG